MDVFDDGVHYLYFLFYPACFSYDKLDSQHHISGNKLLGRISYFSKERFFAIGYAANDLVLVGLWILATVSDISYLSVVICF